MKILHLKFIIICVVNLYAISTSFAQDLDNNSVNFSPRSFCQNTKGAVTETGIRHIYICCYSKKQKCIINDEHKGYSWLIQLSKIEIEK